ncbi:hypothetical protein BDZ85DRAFT_254547 [Elsinoe ampelina]|uniref:Uncharacterized protein n=1 Tax=Elsinoe ampelina TaxID=302913 RepID=A0A6A6GPT1_9PEZI|nr:hypothetical protein BDZ85DRAFT_254547 [Elsinoe ampelina]
MENDNLASSPDPISILADSSPAKPQRAGTPIRPKSSNLISPSKTIVLNTRDPNGQSPWKIKVTVEAEPGFGIDRSVTRRAAQAGKQTTKVPINDNMQSSPVKRRGRPRKSVISQNSQVAPRRVTRRSTKLAGASRGGSLGCNDGDDEATDAAPKPSSPRTQKSQETAQPTLAFEKLGSTTQHDEEIQVGARQQRSFSPSPSTVNHKDGSEQMADQDDHFDIAEDLPNIAPGDATTIENEEFSMISVDSLSSHQSSGSKPVPQGIHEAANVSVSYMPSSPPALSFPLHTPQLMQSPEQPDAPLQSFIKFPQLMTPLRESAVRSGKVLQDIVRSPDRMATASRDSVNSGNLFAGFSADTRRQLRESLQMGAAIADRESCGSSSHTRQGHSNSSGITYPALEVCRSDHRLPTPDDRDQDKSASTLSSGPPVYPRISPSMHEPSIIEPPTNISRRSYDLMSWAPTGPSHSVSPPKLTTTTASPQQSRPQIRSNVIVVPSDSEEDLEDDDDDDDDPLHEGGESVNDSDVSQPDRTNVRSGIEASGSNPGEEEADIWQEEASRSIEVEEQQDEVSALLEQVPAPRRSKIPGTWRRTSGNHFYYSDSPEPETVIQRQVSSAESSGKESGVVTPPATDDEDEVDEEPHDSFQDVHESGAKQNITTGFEVEKAQEEDLSDEVLSPFSEAGSIDGDDTGLFWHSNLPNVFQGRRKAQHTTELSALSELLPISSPGKSVISSAVKRPALVRSPIKMRPVAGSVHSTQKSAVLSSPLRKSLLKSSKIGGSPVSGNPDRHITRPQRHEVAHQPIPHTRQMELEEGAETSEDGDHDQHTPEESEIDHDGASVASDTRQLLSEMAAQDKRQNVETGQQSPHSESEFEYQDEQSGFETTYLNGSRSYVENLNLSSPTKIRVKFNDSSHMSTAATPRPVLSPRKYHSLFDDNAPLGESVQSQGLDGAVEEEPISTPALVQSTPQRPKSLLSRMNTSFWSVITSQTSADDASPSTKQHLTRPSSARSSQHDPGISLPSIQEAEPSDTDVIPSPAAYPVVRDSTSIPETNTSDAILRLRRKYGLLTPCHPFTMCHARTLHRLLHSVLLHQKSTIVPSTSVVPLSSSLTAMIGETYDSPTFHTSLTFTTDHLRAINAFMYLLVDDAERSRLERNGEWGDEGAKQAKGWDTRGRHGTWFAFAGEGRAPKEVRAMRGPIEADWVARVLAEVVLKEERMALVRGKEKA